MTEDTTDYEFKTIEVTPSIIHGVTLGEVLATQNKCLHDDQFQRLSYYLLIL